MAIITDDERIRNDLFHDVEEKSNPSGHSKEYCHMRLAEGIFEDMIDGWNDSEDLRKDYAASDTATIASRVVDIDDMV